MRITTPDRKRGADGEDAVVAAILPYDGLGWFHFSEFGSWGLEKRVAAMVRSLEESGWKPAKVDREWAAVTGDDTTRLEHRYCTVEYREI